MPFYGPTLVCRALRGAEEICQNGSLSGGEAAQQNEQRFVADGRLYISYTYDGIFGSVVESLPDFSRPFLLPRGGRQGLRIEGPIAHFDKRESSLSHTGCLGT